MKSKIKVVSIALFLLALMMLVSCQKQKAEWKGTIEEENGVTVVKNPKEPMYGEDVFSLEEELSIGVKEGRVEYMFSGLTEIAVDEDERIYVLDSRAFEVKVFDKEGDYIGSIGRKGQGPGEFQGPDNIRITPQKKLMINDLRKLLFFSLDGDFIRQVSSAELPYFSNPKMDSKGNIVGSTMVMDLNPKSELKKYNSNLELILDIAHIDYPGGPVIDPFMPEFCSENTKEDNIIWGIPIKYELQVLDLEGRTVKKIVKDYDPVEITEEEKEKQMKNFPYPDIKLDIHKYHSAFRRLTIDDTGRIYIETWEKTEDGEGYYYDVFDSEGKYIAKIPLKARPQVWKKNRLYTIEEDEEGYQFVKRYKVTWKY